MRQLKSDLKDLNFYGDGGLDGLTYSNNQGEDINSLQNFRTRQFLGMTRPLTIVEKIELY